MTEKESKLLHPKLSFEVMGAAIEVHKNLGPGLLEKIYHRAMEVELTQRGLRFESKVPIKATYKGVELGLAYEADMVVEGLIVLEFKSVEALNSTFTAQCLSYMEILDCPIGYLLNFNCANLMHQGKRRLVRQPKFTL